MSKCHVSDKQAHRWERFRGVRGFGLYVLLVGALGWGCSTAILVSVFTWAFSIGPESFIDRLNDAFLAYPIAGAVLFGPLTWTIGEAGYLSWRQAKRNAERHGG